MNTSKTVLIVDDSRVARFMIRSRIESLHPNWQIIEAVNGQEVLALDNLADVDLMIIDVNMPGIDGITLTEQIRATYSEAHIAILTANVQASIRQRAHALGAHFFTKPLTDDKVSEILALADNPHA